MWESRKPQIPQKKVMERATEERSTYPPLNLPSVRQATSRERPAPMIKLVGFNISGIPKCGDRDDRRYHDKMGKSAKRRAKRGKADQDKTAIGAPKEERTKGGLIGETNSVIAANPTTKEENDRVVLRVKPAFEAVLGDRGT